MASLKVQMAEMFICTVALKCQTQLFKFIYRCSSFLKQKRTTKSYFPEKTRVFTCVWTEPGLLQRVEVISCLLPVSGSKRQLCFLSCCCFGEVSLYYATLIVEQPWTLIVHRGPIVFLHLLVTLEVVDLFSAMQRRGHILCMPLKKTTVTQLHRFWTTLFTK